jgi:RNA polymerase sigma factor (sigma-70 family)
MSQEEAIRRREALEVAYRTHVDYVFTVCLKLASGDRDWALDRAHDVFLRLDANLSQLELDRDLRPWLRRVAVNECLMDLRRRERRRRLLGLFDRVEEVRAASPDDDLARDRDVARLDVALGALPARQRVLLSLMYFEGESLTDAATMIGVSKGQASKLHKRALEALGQREWEGKA